MAGATGKLDPVSASQPGLSVRLGNQSVPAADILRCEASRESIREVDSALTTITVFMGVAGVFLFLVFTLGWQFRIALAALLFGSIAFVSLDDLRRGSRIEVFRLDVFTRTGERIKFVTADFGEFQKLLGLLNVATEHGVRTPAGARVAL